jgi:type I restriction enzyme S subunit
MKLDASAASKPLHVPKAYGRPPEGWSWSRLDEVSEGVFDCPHSTPKLTESGPFVVRTQDIITGIFRPEEAARVSEQTYKERTNRVTPSYGDLLYSREGTYFGIAAEVPLNSRICLGQRMVLIRPNEQRVDFRFLRYWLNSPIMTAHIHGYRDGTVAERLNLPTIRALPILVPPLPSQRVIATVLGALEDKIELNRRMNATLESIARSLFQSWFVDFDPVRAKLDSQFSQGIDASTAARFSNSFQDSELGHVPSGWSVVSIGKLCESIFSGGTPNTKIKGYWGGGVPWLSSGETRSPFIIETEKSITAEGIQNSSTRKAKAGCTVIAGAGQGHTRGQTSYLTFDSYINQSVVALAANTEVASDLFLFFDLARRYEEFRQLSDSHSSRGSLTTKLVSGVKTVLPPKQLIIAFDQKVAPLVNRIAVNLRETRTLKTLRDTLVPRLLRGETHVDMAAEMAEARL